MKIVPIQITNNSYGAAKDSMRSDMSTFKKVNTPKDSINFTGSIDSTFKKIIDKINKKITYTNADKIIEEIDNILGEKYFSNVLKNANVTLDKNNNLVLDKRTFGGDFLKTLKYPIVDLPLDIANSFLGFLTKTPFKKPAEALLNSKLLKMRSDNALIEKNYNIVRDVMEQFAQEEGTFNLGKASKDFTDSVTSSIVKTTANYNSRDERALNRAGTLFVSAVFSALDFFHLSMLQKDDEKEAKKAQKARFKQEFSRMILSTGMTYLTLGVFDKYTKNSVGKNALVIAISALISEVGSRLFSRTPLHPLSPEEAEKYAQNHKTDKNLNNREIKNQQNDKKDIETKKDDDKDEDDDDDKPKNQSFSGAENATQIFKERSEQMNNVFSQFKKEDGKFAILENFSQTDVEIPKKKRGFKDYLFIATGISSLAYLLKKGVSGELVTKFEKRKLYKKFADEMQDFVKSPSAKMSGNLLSGYSNVKETAQKRAERFKPLKERITKRKVEVPLFDVRYSLEELKKMPEAKGVQNLLDEYIKHIDELINEGITFKKAHIERPIAGALYEGATKVFKTAYVILSAPAVALNGLIDKVFFSNSNSMFKKVDKKVINSSAMKYRDEVDELIRVTYKNNKIKDPKKIAKANKNLLNTIIKDSRNFEQSPETGELANFSRTCVTGISTYFFVNDYTNKVLIESGGKNVDEAKEERNQRIAHKISNFVINGTLMNLFNSLFKTQLNDALWKATTIAMATEVTNETLVRKSICQPVKKMHSRQDIIDYENKQMQRKGLFGAWTRMFKKITGKKTLVEKADSEKA